MSNTTIAVGNRCADKFSVGLYLAGKWIRRTVIPLQLLLGFPGNVLLYRTMQSMLYRSIRMAIFFKTIAIVDSFYLAAVLARWIESMDFVNINELMDCGWFFLLVFASSAASNWLLLFLNLDRTLFVLHRDLSEKYFERRVCKLLCILTPAIFGGVMVHWPFIIHYNSSTYQFSGTPCVYVKGAQGWGNVGWPIFYNLICLWTPFFGILACSIVLVGKVKDSRKKTGAKMRKRDLRALQSTVIVSIFHLVVTAPYGFIQVLTDLVNKNLSCKVQALWIFINVLLLEVLFFNFALKFYLLLAQAEAVRKNMRAILRNEQITTTAAYEAFAEHPPSGVNKVP